LASANRDEEVFANASQFDGTRTPNPHLSFGGGPHACVSAALTRLTLRSFLELACEQVARFERAGDVAWTADNRFYGLERLPVRFIGKSSKARLCIRKRRANFRFGAGE
jgi:cytochrome P450